MNYIFYQPDLESQLNGSRIAPRTFLIDSKKGKARITVLPGTNPIEDSQLELLNTSELFHTLQEKGIMKVTSEEEAQKIPLPASTGTTTFSKVPNLEPERQLDASAPLTDSIKKEALNIKALPVPPLDLREDDDDDDEE